MKKQQICINTISTNNNPTTGSELPYSTKTDLTNSNSTPDIQLVVNYQIATDINSTNRNSTTGSKQSVSYQISTKTDSTNRNSTQLILILHPSFIRAMPLVYECTKHKQRLRRLNAINENVINA